jgi:hypothetical protein
MGIGIGRVVATPVSFPARRDEFRRRWPGERITRVPRRCGRTSAVPGYGSSTPRSNARRATPATRARRDRPARNADATPRRGPAAGKIQHGQLHIAPTGARLLGELPFRPHGTHDQPAMIHDHARVHEPRPRAVVIEFDQPAADVIGSVRRRRRSPAGRDRPRCHRQGLRQPATKGVHACILPSFRRGSSAGRRSPPRGWFPTQLPFSNCSVASRSKARSAVDDSVPRPGRAAAADMPQLGGFISPEKRRFRRGRCSGCRLWRRSRGRRPSSPFSAESAPPVRAWRRRAADRFSTSCHR